MQKKSPIREKPAAAVVRRPVDVGKQFYKRYPIGSDRRRRLLEEAAAASKQASGCSGTTLVTADHRWGRYFQHGDRNNRHRQQQGHIVAAASPWHTYNKRRHSCRRHFSAHASKCRLRRQIPPGQTINQATPGAQHSVAGLRGCTQTRCLSDSTGSQSRRENNAKTRANGGLSYVAPRDR